MSIKAQQQIRRGRERENTFHTLIIKMFAAENGLKGDPRLQAISEAIRVIPHFPKPGFDAA